MPPPAAPPGNIPSLVTVPRAPSQALGLQQSPHEATPRVPLRGAKTGAFYLPMETLPRTTRCRGESLAARCEQRFGGLVRLATQNNPRGTSECHLCREPRAARKMELLRARLYGLSVQALP